MNWKKFNTYPYSLKKIVYSFVGVFMLMSLSAQDSTQQNNKKSFSKNTNAQGFDPKKIEGFLSIGQVNGKIIDSTTSLPLNEVSVQIFVTEWDTIGKKMKEKLIKNVSTTKNGEFLVEDLPLSKKLKIQFVGLGYHPLKQKVEFAFSFDDMKNSGGDFSKLISKTSKDLGTIRLSPKPKELQDKETLNEVVISSKKSSEIGKQIFQVDKNIVSAGMTAQEMLKTVPMLNVDVEGNVTLRGGSPQIFIDGKPSTLSLDQIPSDLIEKVEVITNPSAKYDAESSSGIVNIVLKRSTKLGINAIIMGGSMLYMQPYKNYSLNQLYQYNGGLILNIRKNKLNTYLNLLTFQRRFHSEGEVDRNFMTSNNVSNYMTKLKQETIGLGAGNMNIIRGGLDYFINNYNTISLDINFMRGHFVPFNQINQSNIYSSNVNNFNTRESNSDNIFKNFRNAIHYKRNFAKDGHELAASIFGEFRDINFQNTLTSQYFTTYSDMNTHKTGTQQLQKNDVESSSQRFRFQTDYTNPINDSSKIETGLNITYSNTPFSNHYYSLNSNHTFNQSLSKNKYEYGDFNIAAYGTYSKSWKNLSLQAGLRLEQFFYNGTLYDNTGNPTKYTFSLPLMVFPSLFLTRKINEENQIQASYSMRINRPSIFNLIPLIDYTDSTNLRQGNPGLLPEVIHIGEINYQYTTKQNYFLLSFYVKQTNDVITQYLKTDSTNPSKKLLINTFVNSQSALSYGFETVLRNSFLKDRLELTSNVNVYNTLLNGGNAIDIHLQRWTFYAKESIGVKLQKGFSFQIFFDYQHESLMPPSSGNRSSGNQQPGGPPNLTPPNSSSQGYIRANFGLDIALKKEFLKGLFSLTLTGTDILQTRKYNAFTYAASSFEQNAWSVRNQSLFYLNFNIRVGKMDLNVMKKKNLKAEKEQAQDAGNQGGF